MLKLLIAPEGIEIRKEDENDRNLDFLLIAPEGIEIWQKLTLAND